MVAYSFKAIFEARIATGLKRQTVRGKRDRHARVGESMQLYVGMRTKSCHKIRPDVVCTSVKSIEICTSHLIDSVVASIAIDGVPLNACEIELFAIADGFAPNFVKPLDARLDGRTARENMGLFWVAAHGYGRFEGVLIEWEQS
jgi:hypothetical protein